MKNVLITGYNGYLGPHLVNLFKKEGYGIVGIDTDYFGPECNFYDPRYGEGRWINKDTRHVSENDLEGVDVICHLAALSNDPMGELDKSLTYDINHAATVRLAQLAKKVGVKRFIFSSSCSIYGIAGDAALTEESPVNPVTAYAESKIRSERDLIALADDNFCVVSLRNATAYGDSPKLRVDLVVNNMVGWAVSEKQIKILSDGSPWRPLIHGEDIARAFVAAAKAPASKVNKQAFNTGIESENYQIKTIAEQVRQVVPGCKVVITGEHGADSRTYNVSFKKIQTLMPEFKPQWNLRKGIEGLYESYLRNGMDSDKFQGRLYTRLKQLKHLMTENVIDDKLFWLVKGGFSRD